MLHVLLPDTWPSFHHVFLVGRTYHRLLLLQPGAMRFDRSGRYTNNFPGLDLGHAQPDCGAILEPYGSSHNPVLGHAVLVAEQQSQRLTLKQPFGRALSQPVEHSFSLALKQPFSLALGHAVFVTDAVT